MIVTTNASLEDGVDVMAEILISPEFARALEAIHAAARRKINLRIPEWVYTEDIETPDGYPCCELIALTVEDNRDSTAQELTHEVSAQWTVNGDNEQVMGREVKRLIMATRDVFRSTSFLPHVGGSVWTGVADFGPVVSQRPTTTAASDNRWIKSASISIFWKAFAR